ncbi:hypothetical protein WA158_000349 [Blastocystis sp. Blastoise]
MLSIVWPIGYPPIGLVYYAYSKENTFYYAECELRPVNNEIPVNIFTGFLIVVVCSLSSRNLMQFSRDRKRQDLSSQQIKRHALISKCQSQSTVSLKDIKPDDPIKKARIDAIRSQINQLKSLYPTLYPVPKRSLEEIRTIFSSLQDQLYQKEAQFKVLCSQKTDLDQRIAIQNQSKEKIIENNSNNSTKQCESLSIEPYNSFYKYDSSFDMLSNSLSNSRGKTDSLTSPSSMSHASNLNSRNIISQYNYEPIISKDQPPIKEVTQDASGRKITFLLYNSSSRLESIDCDDISVSVYGSRIDIDDTHYVIIQHFLGMGGMALVFLCDYYSSLASPPISLALKVNKPIHEHASMLYSRIQQEALMLSRAHHNLIVRYIKTICIPRITDITGFLMEFFEGTSLVTYIQTITASRQQELPGLREYEIIPIIRQLLQAVAYLESIGIAHMDIKPGNILINSQQQIKLIDFGTATEIVNSLSSPSDWSYLTQSEPQGYTPAYAAPELVLSAPTLRSDIFSIGATVFQMITNQMPRGNVSILDSKTRYELLKVSNQDTPGEPFPPKYESFFSTSFINFYELCYRNNAESRPHASELLHHKLFLEHE